MYEAFFQLSRRPFSVTADPSCCFTPEPVQEALAELALRVECGQGIGILTAAPGTGKTLLCHRLIAALRERFVPVFIPNSSFPAPRALLQAILFELGHPYGGLDEQELRLELVGAVRRIAHEGRHLLLVIDEAHLLNDLLLEEVRLLANLAEGGDPLVRVMLSGQLLLEERLTSPALESLNQRVACHVYLDAFTRQESIDYLNFRLNWAGSESRQIFTPAALDVIAHVCNGLPRCINQLCDHSMLLAFVAESPQVERQFVEDALADLKQLPLQWNDPLPAAPPPDLEPALEMEPDHDFPHRPCTGHGFTETEQPGHDGLIGTDPAEPPALESASFEIGAEQPATEDHDNSTGASAGAPHEARVTDERNGIGNSPTGRETVVPTEQICTLDGAAEPEVFSMEQRLRHGVVPLQDYHATGRIFEEEIVIDRYAALDAGQTPPPLESQAAHTGDRTAPVPADASSEDDGEYPQNRPDLLIDQIIPLLKDACHYDDVDAADLSGLDQSASPLLIHLPGAGESRHSSRETPPPLPRLSDADDDADEYEDTGDADSKFISQDADPYGQSDDEYAARHNLSSMADTDLEESLASSVLDVCLDVEEALTGISRTERADQPEVQRADAAEFETPGPLAGYQPEMGEDTSDDGSSDSDTVEVEGFFFTQARSDEPQYDVIEPEPESLPPAAARLPDPRHRPGHAAPVAKPDYKHIFSTLRRKQRG